MSWHLAKKALPVAIAALACWGIAAARAQTPNALPKAPDWRTPAVDDVRSQVLAWLDTQKPEAAIRAEAETIWPAVSDAASGPDLLQRLAETIALVDEDARRLVDLCAKPREAGSPPSFPRLGDPATPPLVADNLRLVFGRWLAGGRMYDEAREQLADLRPEDVVDPASLLFYQAVVYHRLLERDAALAAIARLLKGSDAGPKRYAAVARLMKADVKDLEEDTLDHIARRMEDIERRLALGRAGPKVREVEDGVIESLDKLIKELEDQQQQSNSAGNSAQSSSPAQDSRILGGKGPGLVTKRDVGSQGGWGNLPPKEREEAMQEISREFPSHYREAIEQYFRRLAGQSSEGE